MRAPHDESAGARGLPNGHAGLGSRAFSLIEIMVAVTLLAVMTIGLLAMFYHTQRAFRLGANQVDILENGRATAQLMSADLQQASPSALTNVMNFETVLSGGGRLDMIMPVGMRTNLLQDVAFLARQGEDWLGITYRVEHNNLGAGTLYRSVIRTNPAAQNPANPMRDWLVVSNLVYTMIYNVPVTNFHRIADGVVHLRVRAFNEFGQLYAPGRRYEDFVATNTVAEEYQFINRTPAYLDLEVGMLDPKALKQFEARTNLTFAARSYLTNHAHRVQLFSQRISLRARPAQFDQFDQWTLY
jgi:prepilin-type N-terminal cleavage/methylation domain-containing protein